MEKDRSFLHWLSSWAQRAGNGAQPEGGHGAARVPAPALEPVFPSKALRKFLRTLRLRPNPVVLDLGPVVGANITFLGEQVGCKIHVEDLYADIERCTRQGTLQRFPEFLQSRFSQPEGSVDGVLCWDVLDYLDPASALTLSAALTRLLRSDGTLLAFFGTTGGREARYVKYVIVDEDNLRYRPYPASCGRQRVLQNRDVIKLFGNLRVTDSFLLKTNLREMLFKKPAYLG